VSARLRVLADERERASGVPGLLRGLGLAVEHRVLGVGDYVVSPGCAVERKAGRDLLQSLYSGRLFDQAHRLTEAYDHPVLIVEGDTPSLIGEMDRPRAAWGALATLALDYGLPVFFTADARQTADLIYTLTRHRGFAKPRGPMLRKWAKTEDLGKTQLELVSGLPGVGPRLADRILRRLGTVRRAFSASVAELSTVKGIGRIRAERVARVLDAPYRPAEGPPQRLLLDEA